MGRRSRRPSRTARVGRCPAVRRGEILVRGGAALKHAAKRWGASARPRRGSLTRTRSGRRTAPSPSECSWPARGGGSTGRHDDLGVRDKYASTVRQHDGRRGPHIAANHAHRQRGVEGFPRTDLRKRGGLKASKTRRRRRGFSASRTRAACRPASSTSLTGSARRRARRSSATRT